MNTSKLNYTLLNKQWIKGEIKGEIKKLLETSKSGKTIYQNLWDAAKLVLRENLIVINIYIMKKNIPNKITLCLKKLEKRAS